MTTHNRFQEDGLTKEDHLGLQLEVMGIWTVQQYQPGPDEVCISIRQPELFGYLEPDATLSPNFIDVLRLRFEDTPDDEREYLMYFAAAGITEEQAQEVADFVVKHRDKKKIVLHCFAGASRSRSMAAAIKDALDLPYRFEVVNSRVYNLVYLELDRVL